MTTVPHRKHLKRYHEQTPASMVRIEAKGLLIFLAIVAAFLVASMLAAFT